MNGYDEYIDLAPRETYSTEELLLIEFPIREFPTVLSDKGAAATEPANSHSVNVGSE
jgi:hypothetical protein